MAVKLIGGVATHPHGLPTSVGGKTLEKAAEGAEAKGEPLDYQPTAAVRGLLDRLPEAWQPHVSTLGSRSGASSPDPLPGP